MTGARQRHSVSFKAKVVSETARQTRTITELAKAYQVHTVQIRQWKNQLLDGVESLFRDDRRRERDEGQSVQAELSERIGRLIMEVEWLKKNVARFGGRQAGSRRDRRDGAESRPPVPPTSARQSLRGGTMTKSRPRNRVVPGDNLRVRI